MLSDISAGYWACEARVSRVEGNSRLEMGSLYTGNVVMGLRVQSRVTPPVSWALPVIATRVYGKPRELNSTQFIEQPHHYPARPMARSLLMCRAAEMVGHINKHQPPLRVRARGSGVPCAASAGLPPQAALSSVRHDTAPAWLGKVSLVKSEGKLNLTLPGLWMSLAGRRAPGTPYYNASKCQRFMSWGRVNREQCLDRVAAKPDCEKGTSTE